MNRRDDAKSVWRTCRVLANRRRLRMLALVVRRPGQTLSALARGVNVTVSAGSQYVRVLETFGMLRTRRFRAWVECWPALGDKAGARGLANALKRRIAGD